MKSFFSKTRLFVGMPYMGTDRCDDATRNYLRENIDKAKLGDPSGFRECIELNYEQLYDDTVLYDPSGFDTEARTTALDLKKVVESLLEYQWFRDIVSKSSYKATLPDESTQMWKNTNAFLDSTSDYYNGNVKGVKTGSLSDDYNLVVLYQQHGKEFLICSLGSKSNSSRYDDVNYIIKTIDESDYLSR